MSYHSPEYFPLFEHVMGTTPAQSYRGLSKRDQAMKIIDTNNTHKLISTIEKGYKKHNAIIQENHSQIVALENEKIEAQRENNQLIDEQNRLIDNQNYILNRQNEILQEQSNILQGIDARLETLNSQNSIINQNIEKLVEIAKIPDFEKERLFYFKEGIKYLQGAEKKPQRYYDALHYLEKAFEINERDFIVNFELGLIYLYNTESIDLQKAKKHFQLAYQYFDDQSKSIQNNTVFNTAYALFLNLEFKESAQYAFKAFNSFLEFSPEKAKTCLTLYIECGMIMADKEIVAKGMAEFFKIEEKEGSFDLYFHKSINQNFIKYLLEKKNVSKSPIYNFFIEFNKELYWKKLLKDYKELKLKLENRIPMEILSLNENTFHFKYEQLKLKIAESLPLSDLQKFEKKLAEIIEYCNQLLHNKVWLNVLLSFYNNNDKPSIYFKILEEKTRSFDEIARKGLLKGKFEESKNELEKFDFLEIPSNYFNVIASLKHFFSNNPLSKEDFKPIDFNKAEIWYFRPISHSGEIKNYDILYEDIHIEKFTLESKKQVISAADRALEECGFYVFETPEVYSHKSIFLLGNLEAMFNKFYGPITKNKKVKIKLRLPYLDAYKNYSTKEIEVHETYRNKIYDIPIEEEKTKRIQIFLENGQFQELNDFYKKSLEKSIENYIEAKHLVFPFQTDEYKDYKKKKAKKTVLNTIFWLAFFLIVIWAIFQEMSE